jgi:hypothetical protein
MQGRNRTSNEHIEFSFEGRRVVFGRVFKGGEMICGDCKHIKIEGLLVWHCKKHDKTIKKWDVKCDDWLDMFFKKGLK